MKLDFEALTMVRKPDAPYFNCTEGGIKINGFEQLTFESFLKKFASDIEISKVTKVNDIDLHLDIHDKLKRILINVNELKELLIKGLTIVKKIESLNQIDQKALKQLDNIEKNVNKLLDKIPMEPMTNSITIDILNHYLPAENETTIETYKRLNRQTKALYTQLQDAINYTEQCIKNVLENSEVENNE